MNATQTMSLARTRRQDTRVPPVRTASAIVASLPPALGAIAIVVLLFAQPAVELDAPPALFTFNFAFGTLAGTCAAILAARAYMQRGQLTFLAATIAATTWALTNLLPVFAAWPGIEGMMGNAAITVRDIGTWLTSLAFLAAIVASTRGAFVRASQRSLWLAPATILSALAMAIIYWLAGEGWFPAFFARDASGTVLGQIVVTSSASIFLLSAALLPPHRTSRHRFHFWFVLSAVLLAEGLVASAFFGDTGLALAWVGRALQWFGIFYMVAALWYAQEARVGRETGVMRLNDDRLWPILTVALVITAAVVRLLFLQALGDANPFITFFIAVLLAAMYGGLKAGLVGTIVAGMAGAFLWMEPRYTFHVTRDADLVSIGIFAVTGIFISAVAEALRRANGRAHAAEMESAARRARAAEDELRLSTAKLKRLVESNIIGIAFADPERVLEANDAFFAIVGFAPWEIHALEWRALTPPEWREADKRSRAMLLATGTCPAYRKELVRKDGTRVPVLVGAAMIESSGKYVCFVQDLADVTRAEDLLKEADRRKDEFLATLAHELRNPMAPIRTAVEILKRVDDPAKRQPVLEMMDRQVRHMVRLIDDLLDVSRITRGKLELQLQRTDVLACVEHAKEACSAAVVAREQRLELDLRATPLFVRGDPVRLAQVVSNLLMNASKYSGPGTAIRVSVEARDGEAVILVRDRGIGLDPGHLATIFGLFTQVAPRATARDGGLGIGLHLVKQLVEMHGGRVCARSEGRGHGSEFEVRLPLMTPEAAAAAPEAQAAARG
jgi:PAS domain S-box-containing protein